MPGASRPAADLIVSLPDFLAGRGGMFFDGYDLYVAASVLASTTQTKFSTLPQNLQFISLTFVA
jgi:hypothetical protein